MTVRIGGIEVDETDPCALWQALYAVKLRMAAGEQIEEIEVRSPVTNQRTRFKPGDLKALDAELDRLQAACNAKSGRRRRFAISGGFCPY